MGRHYMPRQDRVYKDWLERFAAGIEATAGILGLTPADIEPIVAARGEYDSAYEAYLQSRRVAESASAHKRTTRRHSEAAVRSLVRRISHHPRMNDAIRGLLGLTAESHEESTVPIEQLQPGIRLEAGGGQVTVHWGRNPGNEHRNGRPAGVKGANIYRRKEGETDFEMVNFSTTSPYHDWITGPTAEYTYYVRYRGTKCTDLSRVSAAVTVAVTGLLEAPAL